MAAAEPDRDDEAPPTSDIEPAGPAEGAPADELPAAAAPGETREQPALDDQVGQTLHGVPGEPSAETEIRPIPPDPQRPDRAGPGGTSIMPPVEDVPGTPRWSARAQVRTPDLVEEERHEWAEPARSTLVPVLVTVCILLLVALLGLGAWLIFAARPSGITPTTTPTVQNATAPATTGAQATTTTASAAPTPIALPNVRGQDYETAAATLTKLGFIPVRRDEISGELPKGKVTGTDPPVGTPVRPGAKINVIVSLGLPETTPPPTSPSSAHS